jgi:hypothetical protein
MSLEKLCPELLFQFPYASGYCRLLNLEVARRRAQAPVLRDGDHMLEMTELHA